MVVGSSLDYDGYFLEPTYTVKVTDAMDIQNTVVYCIL